MNTKSVTQVKLDKLYRSYISYIVEYLHQEWFVGVAEFP